MAGPIIRPDQYIWPDQYSENPRLAGPIKFSFRRSCVSATEMPISTKLSF